MKKTIIGLAVACVTAFAAFAGDEASTPSWFSEAVSSSLLNVDGGTWSVGGTALAKTPATWTWKEDYGAYNDMDHELVFTTSSGKALPANVATVTTTVKFTAFDAEDAPTGSVPADAKAGLTVIEDANGAHTFVGLVGGEWVTFDNDPDADGIKALDNQVPVSVSFAQDGDTATVCYKVNNVDLTVDGVSKLASTAKNTTISSVSYKGMCEIASLTGDAAVSVYDVTVPAAPVGGVMTATVGGTPATIVNNKIADVAYGASVVLTIAPATDKMVVSGTTEATIPVMKTTDVPATTFGNLVISDIIAKVGTAEYALLWDAVDAITDVGTVTLWADATETFTISGKTVTFVNGPDRDAVVGGVITVAAGATLNIVSGKYNGTINGDGLVLTGGLYNFDKDLVQKYCANQYFAKKSGVQGFPVKVEIGEAVVPSDKVPEGLFVSDEIFPDGCDTAEKKTAFLADASRNANKLMNWQNYVLGIDDGDELPEVAKASASATGLTLNIAHVKVRTQTGYAPVIKIGDTALVNNALPFESSDEDAHNAYKLDIYLGDKIVGTKTVAVDNKVVKDAEATDLKLISVPYKQLNDGAQMTIDEVVNKANLELGDVISAYDGSEKSYLSWTLTSDGWKSNEESMAGGNLIAPPAAGYVVKPGQGLWLKTKSLKFYQYGEVQDLKGTTVELVADEWNLLADPSGSGRFYVSVIKNPAKGDIIRVENVVTTVPVDYTYDDVSGTWGYWQVTEGEKTVRGKKQKITEWMTLEDSIDTGANGVWYVKTAGSQAYIQW